MPYRGSHITLVRKADFVAAFPDINPDVIPGLETLQFHDEKGTVVVEENQILYYEDMYDDGGDVFFVSIFPELVSRGVLAEEQAEKLREAFHRLPHATISDAG
ncbi:MAG: hypothetical protein Q8P39_00720 [Candidatus Yanofskybacteria bacterium]|nr:hypothetical protein [Candidatus Yanofskybacteria bacterium]